MRSDAATGDGYLVVNANAWPIISWNGQTFAHNGREDCNSRVAAVACRRCV
jgi:hypothetical protein